jgi:hypothetical protein
MKKYTSLYDYLSLVISEFTAGSNGVIFTPGSTVIPTHALRGSKCTRDVSSTSASRQEKQNDPFCDRRGLFPSALVSRDAGT